MVGDNFELLFDIRPRSLTGVLLHVGNFSRAKHGAKAGHHLSLYMLKGEVSCGVVKQWFALAAISTQVIHFDVAGLDLILIFNSS